MTKISTILLLFISLTTFGQLDEIRRNAKALTSPAFHGRGYVNGGDSIAAAYIAAEFKSIGIKPLKKNYFQSFTMPVNTFPGKMTVQLGQKTLIPDVHYLVDPSSGGGKMILNPIEIPVSIALDNKLLIDTLQKIVKSGNNHAVVFNLSPLTGDTLKQISKLSSEVAGVLPVIQVTNQKLTWSVSNRQLPFPFIMLEDSIYHKNETISIDIDATLIKEHHTQNVIAYLPAKKKSSKTIVFTAHYDHLGQMGEETYFPGANDNASGTSLLLNLARYYKANPADYNVLFIAFAGEEAGLLGSRYYTQHPVFPLEKMSFLVNIDMMGSGEDGITVVNATLFESEFKLMQQINAEDSLLTQVKSRGPAANSDHYFFTQANVPSFFIYTMGKNKNYHDVFDNYENLTFPEILDLTTLLTEFANQIH